MANDRFEIEPEEEIRQGRGCLGGCAKGCFIIVLVMVALIAVLAYFITQNWRGWAAGFADIAIDEALKASNLPDREQQEIRAELARPIDALRKGELSREQIKELVEALQESPLTPSLAVMVVEGHYFAKSGLTPEEKEQGRLALHRFVRGVIEGKIDEPAVDAVVSHVADKQGNEWRFRETATDEELQALIATAEQEADKAGIPEHVEAVDPSSEIRKIIDAVMGPAEDAQGHMLE
jgi:nucleotide-binding universal stress UspA family protein